MNSNNKGFELRELLFLFHPLVVCAFALVAIGAVLLLYRCGPKSMTLSLASPIYMLWLLTVGCALTGDCL